MKSKKYQVESKKIKKSVSENLKNTPEVNTYALGKNTENFDQYLQRKKLSRDTIFSYRKFITSYLQWKNDRQTSKKTVLEFLESCPENDSRTKAYKVGILRHYYNYLIENELITKNPTQNLKIRGTRKKTIHKILSLEEINELIDCHFLEQQKSKTNKEIHLRNHLILTFSAYQGMSWQEIKALKTKDINLQKGTIFIEKQAKSNSRILKLEAPQIGLLYQYLNQENEQLFTAFADAGRLTKSIQKIYPKFHNFLQLRASFIVHWIKIEGLRKAQYLAGHRYISSTENYLSGNLDELQNDIEHFGSDF